MSALRIVRRRLPVALAAAATVLALAASAASATTPAPAWSIHSFATPTVFSQAQSHECTETFTRVVIPPSCDVYTVTATDSGAAPTSGGQVTLTDNLPSGLNVKKVALFAFQTEAPKTGTDLGPADCETPSALLVRCHYSGAIAPDEGLRLVVFVTTKASASGELENRAEVSGGGAAAPASTAVLNPANAADPPFGFAGFEAPIDGVDGSPANQAGGHAYEEDTRIDLANVFRVPPDQNLENAPPWQTGVEDLRDVVVDLPVGFAGSALSAPRCTLAEMSAAEACPRADILGHIVTEPNFAPTFVNSPVYNLVPEKGVAAEFGFRDILPTAHVLYASIVPGPQGYHLRVTAHETPQVSISTIISDFYGDPAARDASLGEPVPTFTNPAACDEQPLVTSVHVDSWQHPGTWLADGEPDLSDPAWKTASSETPPVSGCNQLAGLFAPTLEAHPTTTQGDSPSGFEVTLKVPQEEKFETLATPPLKKAVVTLPQGMSVNPSSANGLQGCSLAQIGVSADGQPNAEPVRCPDASKIGNLELRTPALPGTLQGQIYVAKQSENPFGSLLALYFVVDDPQTGVLVKIPGEVRADPQTGQLTTVIDNSPQFPFSELTTKFFGGQKAALRTPAVCGKYEVTSTLTPWSAPESGPPAEPAGSFEISEGCAPSQGQLPDHPSFEAGTVSPLAGAYSPFVLKLHREDGSQELSGLSVTLPEGLLGKLAGVEECPEADLALARSREHEGGGAEELASPSCPAASEVGTVGVGAGAGLTPYFTTGHAYLAGPYKGAPLSLAIVTPAVAGPYDLGDVVVRTALQVDPYSARITAVSDEIPHILHGIPLDVRSIDLQMDRHEFTINPTNCEAATIGGTAATVLGQSAPLSNRFQVGGCKALGFKPKLKISLKGRTTRAGHPALKAVLTYPKGAYANIAFAQVGLPHSEFLDQGNIGGVCTQPQLASSTCPPNSVYGRVKAWSPLLEKPLEGNVYLGVGFGHKLPDLVGELNGQIRVLIHGKVDTDKEDGIRNTFETVPDAPVSKFVLELQGGPKKGLLENSEPICSKPQRATAKFVGQNGKVDVFRPLIGNSCQGKGKKPGAGHHKGHPSRILSRLLGGW